MPGLVDFRTVLVVRLRIRAKVGSEIDAFCSAVPFSWRIREVEFSPELHTVTPER